MLLWHPVAPKQAASPSPQIVNRSRVVVVIAFMFVKLPAIRLTVTVVNVFIGRRATPLARNPQKNQQLFFLHQAIRYHKEGKGKYGQDQSGHPLVMQSLHRGSVAWQTYATDCASPCCSSLGKSPRERSRI
jgi:hypothetical protein